MNWFLVFLGGGIGSISRYGISELVKSNFKSSYPLATLLSNIISCLVLALTIQYLSVKGNENSNLRILIITGFCGGFSTFSSFSYETVELIRTGNTMIAIANILISVTVCIAIIYFFTKSTI